MPDFSSLPAGLQIGIATLFGLLFGSFLNVVIHRLPKMLERRWQADLSDALDEVAALDPATSPSLHAASATLRATAQHAKYNLFVPRSACPHCQHPISSLENIPVFSYLALRGKCKVCKTPISMRYPLVEVFTGLIAGILAWQFGLTAQGLCLFGFSCALISLAFIDLDTMLLPDQLTLPLIWSGLLYSLVMRPEFLVNALMGAMAGYLVLWTVYWTFKLLTGKDGMGYGDFKLLAAIGAWLGWQILPQVILLSSLVGAIVGVTLIAFKKHAWQKHLPFGPYLVAAGLLSLLIGNLLASH